VKRLAIGGLGGAKREPAADCSRARTGTRSLSGSTTCRFALS
jgi:hypothetical protein